MPSMPVPSPCFIRLRTLKRLKSLFIELLRLLFFPFNMAEHPSQEDLASSSSNDPPFDPSKPSIPISYPIKELQDLESRSYFESFHYPFNRASVPLPSYATFLPSRRRILVCHDMMGGYVDDKWVQGGTNADAYAIWHWYLMDVFVYFSHNLVTLPPPCWTNAAHTHGVKVLGTFITEWEKGEEICNTLLSTKESAQMYAERLTELAVALGFDGWLINMEVTLDMKQITNLKEFVSHLTQTMHSLMPGSLIIWYDSVTEDGVLYYQNQLNEKNKSFFDLCDGIFVNYTWQENAPKLSAAFAGNRRFDVYMGIDVFGRGKYGGGEWNTDVALDLLKKDDVSAAIFAPGWVYETEQETDFQTAQNRWWGLVEQSWGILQIYPKVLPFYSNFDPGHGLHFSVEGLQVADGPWNNISCQGFQPVLDKSMDPNQTTMQVFINFKDESYSGGGNITCKGSLKDDDFFSTRLFQGQLPLEDLPVSLSYSVKSDGNSLLGLCLGFSSNTNEQAAILLTDDAVSSVDKLTNKYDKVISVPVKKARGKATVGAEWAIYEASIAMDSYTLTDICIICYMKKPDQDDPKLENSTGGYSAYNASLGHISIQNSTHNREFPPADSWVVQGQHISWASGFNGTRTVCLDIIWKLKAGHTQSFMKYNIFVMKLANQANRDPSSGVADGKEFLGVARVETFYVSDLEVPVSTVGLKFIMQVCRFDGACQELDESPAFLLAVEGQ